MRYAELQGLLETGEPCALNVEQGVRTTRFLCVKLNCLNPNPDGVNVRTHRKNA